MRTTSIFSCVITIISNFMTFYETFCCSNIYFQFCFYKYNRFLHFHMVSASLLFIISFFFFFKFIFITCSLKDSKNLSIESFLLHIILIFYSFKWRYCRRWKTWWNLFTYFCSRWMFGIIFISIIFCYYTFKICINNKWCFIGFLILIKF